MRKQKYILHNLIWKWRIHFNCAPNQVRAAFMNAVWTPSKKPKREFLYFWKGRILIPVTDRQTAPLLKWAFCQGKKNKTPLCLVHWDICHVYLRPLNRRTQLLNVLLHWQRLFSKQEAGCLSLLRTLGCWRRRGGRHPGTWRKQFFLCVFCQDDMKWWDSFGLLPLPIFTSSLGPENWGPSGWGQGEAAGAVGISLSSQPGMAFKKSHIEIWHECNQE